MGFGQIRITCHEILYLVQAFAKAFDTTPDDLDMHIVYDVSHNIAKVEEHISYILLYDYVIQQCMYKLLPLRYFFKVLQCWFVTGWSSHWFYIGVNLVNWYDTEKSLEGN